MTIYLVDDEEQARVTMQYYLGEFFPDLNVVGTSSDIVTAGKEIIRLKPDLVFLDINMPGGTGFELLERISQCGSLFVFVSAHKEFAFEAIQVNIFDYLLKPLQIRELTRVITKARNHLDQQSDNSHTEPGKIQVKTDGKTVLLERDEILYVNSEGNYSTIYLVNGKNILLTKNLKKLEDGIFTDLPFFRIHQSYLVNLKKVVEYNQEQITLQGGIQVPIAKARLELLKETLMRI